MSTLTEMIDWIGDTEEHSIKLERELDELLDSYSVNYISELPEDEIETLYWNRTMYEQPDADTVEESWWDLLPAIETLTIEELIAELSLVTSKKPTRKSAMKAKSARLPLLLKRIEELS